MGNLTDFQTDHLILLVGTNPLPNYVAARLLCPTGKVHLLCSADTQNQAQQLEKQLANASIRPLVKESEPQDILLAARAVITRIPVNETVGLHYTGGTKAMSVHTYRAIEQAQREVTFSYLDARKLRLVIDGGMGDGRDAFVPVEQLVEVTVPDILKLHSIHLVKPPKQEPILIDVARAIKTVMDTDNAWRDWAWNHLRREDNKKKFISKGQLKKLPAPADPPIFLAIRTAFGHLGVPKSATLEDWAKVSHNFSPHEMEDFAKWLEGEWLESVVLQTLLDIKGEMGLYDCGMDYQSGVDKFQFDVAATRGYQLFAISCTASQDTDLCKNKLFEAYVRAKQMGGDEARVALVCYHKDPKGLRAKFLNEWQYPQQATRVFGAEDLRDLPGCLTDWINSERSE